MSDERYMRLALRLAARGRTSPNPRVGAVVVRDGKVLATGYHRAAGQPHAEVEALSSLGFQAQGATIYVNLEPCSHFGRTPPCTESILRAGVREVVAGMMDPNPLVEGRGFRQLREAGVAVRTNVLERECQALNRGFTKAITTGLPYVTLKLAATADGKTATRTGASRWITSPESRTLVHRLRAESDAVLVGIGTVLKDDPQLTVRLPEVKGLRQPFRVVLDSQLRTPLTAKILEAEAPTVIITTDAASPEKMAALRDRGVEVEQVAGSAGRIDLRAALRVLAGRGLIYVMAEPGAELAGALATSGLIDRFWFFYAPQIFGGVEAPGMLGGKGVDAVEQAVKLHWDRVRRVGPDLLVEAVPASSREAVRSASRAVSGDDQALGGQR